jgi:Uma2 family endonuclease
MAEPARSPALPATSEGYAWPSQGGWTFEDYLRLPEDGNRYEVIRGFLYVTPAPLPVHQYVLSELLGTFREFVVERKLGVVVPGPMDIRLPNEISNPVQPDLVFLRTGNQPHWESDRGFDGVPDLIVEILSRRTFQRDRKIKFAAYRDAGVQEYWLVDPKARTVVIYVLSADRRRYDEHCRGGQGDTVRSGILSGLEVRVSDLFPPR